MRGFRAEAEQSLADLRTEPARRTETFAVRLPADVAASLRRAAEADGVSIAEEIRLSIAERIAGAR